MIKIQYFFVLLIITFSLSACKKAVPELSKLSTLEGFSLDQNSAQVSKSNITFAVSGRCRSNFNAVQVSLDGGTTWKDIKSYDSSAQIKCQQSTNNFSADFSISANTIPVSIASLSSYSLRFRGVSEIGFSDEYSFLLSFAGPAMPGQIVSGSMGGVKVSNIGNYKMAGRIQAMSTGGTLTTTNYKLKGVLTHE
jgi:hypothetical protein